MSFLSQDQSDEISAARADTSQTSRYTSVGAEEVMHLPVPVLDAGFVRLVDYMGDDRSIPQAARMSYGKGTAKLSNDEALIRYLMRHWHTTPFEMVQAKFHVKLPIFSARQWMRHRAGTFNEYSARYSLLDAEFYVPEPEQLAAQSKSNKQGRANVLEGAEAERVLTLLKEDAARCYDHYVEMVNEDDDGNKLDPERSGLARELARMNLPVNTYTQFYWTVNAHNLFHFLRLRQDSHAQYEIRVYADAIANDIVSKWIPISHRAFEDFHRGAKSLSRQGAALMNAALLAAANGEKINPADFGLAGRELSEVRAAFPALEVILG
jgi:thymidylate synthase (FAD)